MIKGTHRGIRSLKTLLYFGGDQNLFEKEIIHGIDDGIILGNTYNFSKEEVDVYVQERIDEDVTETTIQTVKYPKDQLIEYSLDIETYHCIDFLRKNFYEEDNYGKHQWLFARILKCYLSAFNINQVECPYRDVFIEYFSEIVKVSLSLYDGLFDFHANLKKTKDKLKAPPASNITGFKLKPYLLATIETNGFIDYFITEKFIDVKDRDLFKTFLQGKIPAELIEWKRELKYFVYFINKLIEKHGVTPTYLITPPGQQWKNLRDIFSHPDLTGKFYERFNKLGKKPKKCVDVAFEILAP